MGGLTEVVGHLQAKWLRRALEIACASGGFIAGLLVSAGYGLLGPDIDAIKLVAVVIGSVLGASLGILGARALSRDSDSLTTRRRLNSITLKIGILERLLNALVEQFDKQQEKLKDLPKEKRPTHITDGEAGYLSATVFNVTKFGADVPNFDGVLETTEDVVQARAATGAFNHAATLMVNAEDWKGPTEKSKVWLAIYCADTEGLTAGRDTLAKCKAHFEAKRREIGPR